MALPKNSNILPYAKQLRRNMTDHECKLWYLFLHKYPIKFSKQKIIGKYIADFYCHSAKLVIELDGSQHYEDDAEEYDKRRTAYFDSLGIHTMRFSNLDIDKQFKNVCEHIDNYINHRI